MSDIPVGSPPAPPGRHAAPGGWYPDPLDAGRERYWDGWQWSRDTRAVEGPAPHGPAASVAAGPYGQGYGQGHRLPAAGSHGGGAGVGRQLGATADGVPLAGWWWRALGGLVDALLTGTVSLLLTLPLYRDLFSAFRTFYVATLRAAQTGGTPPTAPAFASMISGTDQLLVALVAFVVGIGYHVPFLRLRGATPGLLVCGLRVVPVDQGRATGRLGWPAVLVRAALWVLPGALSLRIFTVADVLVPLWHPRRQTLHDMAARTQVVRLR